jgi:hypothetical protein
LRQKKARGLVSQPVGLFIASTFELAGHDGKAYQYGARFGTANLTLVQRNNPNQ